MPTSKQDSRFHEGADQHLRLFNNTQGQNTNARMQAAGDSSSQKKSQDNMGPTQLLEEHMDATGNPVPDTAGKKTKDDDVDLFKAMSAEIDDFD